MIMVGPDGMKQPVPCYNFYHSARRGFPQSQVHYAFDGYKIDVDTIAAEPTQKGRFVKDEFGNTSLESVEMEQTIDNLGPMYAHHFGKRKQKPKAEKEVSFNPRIPDVEPEVDDETFGGVPAANKKPGQMRDAPRMSSVPSVKL